MRDILLLSKTCRVFSGLQFEFEDPESETRVFCYFNSLGLLMQFSDLSSAVWA
jgi:hypothetical protein